MQQQQDVLVRLALAPHEVALLREQLQLARGRRLLLRPERRRHGVAALGVAHLHLQLLLLQQQLLQFPVDLRQPLLGESNVNLVLGPQNTGDTSLCAALLFVRLVNKAASSRVVPSTQRPAQLQSEFL